MATLSPRHVEILRLAAEGHSNKVIAVKVKLSDLTVKNHISGILRKLEVPNRTAAVNKALLLGILNPPGVVPFQERPHEVKSLTRVVEPVTWYQWADLLLCPEMYILKVNGEALKVTEVVFKLIHYFLTHPFTVHSCDNLINCVWGGQNRNDATVRVFIAKVRDTLEPYGYADLIETVVNEGYRVSHKYAVTIQKTKA